MNIYYNNCFNKLQVYVANTSTLYGYCLGVQVVVKNMGRRSNNSNNNNNKNNNNNSNCNIKSEQNKLKKKKGIDTVHFMF